MITGAEEQLVRLMIFGAIVSCGIGIMVGIMIKHFIDLPYIMAVKYSEEVRK